MKNCLFLLASLYFAPLMGQKTSSSTPSKNSKAGILYGTASYYADKFQGRPTASGEPYDKTKMTCACNKLPLGTWVKVTNLKNKKQVVVKIIDRLHYKNERLVDLSRAAASKLGYIGSGLTKVEVEKVPPPAKKQQKK